MKRRFIYAGFAFAILFTLLNGYHNTARSNLSGAPVGVTGSPGDGTSCINCHSPRANFTGSGTITTNIPPGGYTAGQTYIITASITRAGHNRIGFELSPQDTTPAGNFVGTISVTNSTTTKLAGTGYITHKSAGTTAANGSISWSCNWVAPATGRGPVVFYCAFNASNHNNSDNGDSIFLASLKIYENTCVAPAPPTAIVGDTTICAGSTITYTVPPVNGATSYTWILPNGWTGTSTTNSITVVTDTSSGEVSVAAVSACGSASSPLLAMVTVNPVSPVTITASGDTLTAGTGSYQQCQWYLNDSAIAGATNQSYIATTTGNYSVKVTNTNGCEVTSPPYSYVAAGILNYSEAKSISVFPNPTTGMLTIDYREKINGSNTLIQVYAANGQAVLERRLPLTSNPMFYLDLSNLPGGLYVLKVSGNGSSACQKLVLNK